MEEKERILNQHEGTPFYINKLEKAFLTKVPDGYSLEVFLDKKNFVGTEDLDENGISTDPWLRRLRTGNNPAFVFVRKQLSKVSPGQTVPLADSDHPIRWVGSGAMLILREGNGDRHAVVNQRHPLASWPGYFDINGGYSASIADMLYPCKLAEKELREEVIIKKNGKKVDIKAKALPVGNTEVKVHFKGQEFVSRNLILIVDASTGVIDFRQVFEMPVGKLSDYTFEDGETRFTGSHEEVSQKRPILLFKLESLTNMTGRESKFTPALLATLKEYGKHF